MEKARTKGITASELKYIAILAMTIDHIAWAFVPIDSLLAQLMHAVGRITAPIMCFFISEGFHHTRSLKKYMLRMAVFAVISQVAFCFYNTGSFFSTSTKENMITTLFLCLITVWTVNNEKLCSGYKLGAVLFICFLAEYCDWGSKAIIFTLAFELSRDSRKKQLTSYGIAAVVCCILPLIKSFISAPSYAFSVQSYNFGVILSIMLLYIYNGQRGGGKVNKWFFYIYYPAHLLLLGYLAFYK